MDDIADLITQQGEIARRRKLLEAMQGQNMQTSVQGSSKGYSIGQALAKVATAYMLGRQGDDLAGQERSNRESYTDALQSGLQSYLNTRDGVPAQEMPGPMPDGKSVLMSPAVAANPREAIVRAMASQMPELQAIGKADFAGLAKNAMSQNDWLKLADQYDPQSVVRAQQANDPRLLQPKKHVQVVNNQAVDFSGTTPQPLFDGRDRFGPVGPQGKDRNGDNLIGQVVQGTGEVRWGPQGQTINVGDTADKIAMNQSGEVLKNAREQVLDAQQGLSESRRLMALASDPSIASGFTAGPEGMFQAIAAKLKLDPKNAAAATQALVSGIAAQTLEASKELKGSISEKEKPFLEQARAGQIQYTPEALQYLAGLSMAVNHNRLLNAVQQHSSAASIPGGDLISKLHPLPALGSWEMPENLFAETVNGRVRYRGTPVNPQPGKPAGTPTVSNWNE
jgi:hypothetical protein